MQLTMLYLKEKLTSSINTFFFWSKKQHQYMKRGNHKKKNKIHKKRNKKRYIERKHQYMAMDTQKEERLRGSNSSISDSCE